MLTTAVEDAVSDAVCFRAAAQASSLTTPEVEQVPGWPFARPVLLAGSRGTPTARSLPTRGGFVGVVAGAIAVQVPLPGLAWVRSSALGEVGPRGCHLLLVPRHHADGTVALARVSAGLSEVLRSNLGLASHVPGVVRASLNHFPASDGLLLVTLEAFSSERSDHTC